MRKIFFIAVVLIVCYDAAVAQYLPVGTPALEDYYRREQLLGRLDSNISFTLRPAISPLILSAGKNVFYPDSLVADSPKGLSNFSNGKGYVYLLPVSFQQKFNSSYPYGWNDGAMIPAKGYQNMVSAGVFIKYGILTIQFKPEFVYAANLAYDGFGSTGRSDAELAAYYRFYNNIDQPERFGNGSYKKAFLGQSSIRLNFDPLSIGISNENLWWGPGINNSLVLSNNAPGFKHLTLNTTRPIRFFLGHFEGQIIAGRLDGTGLAPINVTKQSNGNNLYNVKPTDWRYFTGFNINYHPKWVPGLTLGFTRTFQAYKKDVNTLADYLPYFFLLQKGEANQGDPIPRDQHLSVYARWLFTKANAEVYVEYGLNDNSYNYRDFIGSPDHSRAYIFGVRKMVKIKGVKDQHIMFSTEVTQISQTPDRLIRPLTGWYTHFQVKQGYTHLGQILGAGSGGNMQTADISWVSGLKKLGFSFERYERNTDLTDRSFTPIDGNSRNWVDVGLALHGEWNYRNLIFNARLQQIKSLNYQWVTKGRVADSYYVPNNNAYNFYAQLGATYRF